MRQTLRLLNFREEDHRDLSIEELSRYARLSRAFVQLCIDLGCRVRKGKLSHATLLGWLTQNYAEFRACAGLPALAPIDGVKRAALCHLQIANTMLTLIDYAASRSVVLAEKERLAIVRRCVVRADR